MTNEFSHSVRLAVKASQTTVDSHALIYWPEEECVSITEMTRIIEGKLAEGEQCRVRVGRRVYIGIIVRLGTESNMKVAEELFLEGLLDVPESNQDKNLSSISSTESEQHTTPTLPRAHPVQTPPHTTPTSLHIAEAPTQTTHTNTPVEHTSPHAMPVSLPSHTTDTENSLPHTPTPPHKQPASSTTSKHPPARDTRKRAPLQNITASANNTNKGSQQKKKKKTNETTQEPTGKILDLALFDPAQKDVRINELFSNVKMTTQIMLKLEAQMTKINDKFDKLEATVKELMEGQKNDSAPMTMSKDRDWNFNDSLDLDVVDFSSTPISMDNLRASDNILNPSCTPSVSISNTMSHTPATISTVTNPISAPSNDLSFTTHGITPPLTQTMPPTFGMNSLLPIPTSEISEKSATLPSSEIQKDTLRPIAEVLSKYSHLRNESKMGVLAVKLSREAIFGDNILKRCTPRGMTGLPALPQAEMNLLKTTLFRQFARFWSAPEEFERKWINAQVSVAQCCKRLRKL